MDKHNDDIKTLQEAITNLQAQMNRIVAAPHAQMFAMNIPVIRALQFTPGKGLQDGSITNRQSTAAAAATVAAASATATTSRPT